MSLKSRITRFLEDNRAYVIVFFCLPASLIFDVVLYVRGWLTKLIFPNSLGHIEKVINVQKQVAAWNRQPKDARRTMCTARPNWLSLSTTFFNKSDHHQIRIDMTDILEFDETTCSVRVEPGVTVGQITDYLVPRNFALAVTLEIAEATLGGLAMAVGMTTHSHKVGLFQENVVSYDMVLGDGSLVRASEDTYTDLFYALPWSHGTLGFLVALELKVVPIKPYLRLRYIPVKGQTQYCNMMRDLSGALDASKEHPDYLEATVYSKDEAVIMVGNFTDVDDESLHKVNHVTRWYKPWFYKHVESKLDAGQTEDIIPMREYLLRHNRAIFWVLESMIPFGNHPLFRLFLGWLCPPRIAFLKFTTTESVRAMTFAKQVFQDVVMPMTVLEQSINLSEDLFDTYPILIYPCRIINRGLNKGQLKPPRPEQMCPNSNYGMFYDLGVYGVPSKVKRREKYNAVSAMQKMEAFLRKVGGYSFLYADIFMNRKEFEEMFDLTLYEKARRKYSAEGAFPHLYDKVKPEIDVIEVGKMWEEPL